MREPNCEYKVTIEGAAPENTSAGSFEILFYSSNNGGGFVQEDMEGEEEEGNIQNLDLVEPLQYTGSYTPNKYGVIVYFTKYF